MVSKTLIGRVEFHEDFDPQTNFAVVVEQPSMVIVDTVQCCHSSLRRRRPDQIEPSVESSRSSKAFSI